MNNDLNDLIILYNIKLFIYTINNGDKIYDIVG